MVFDTTRLKNFPEASGVYQMKNNDGEVLYVGKAKNLRARVRQYFQGSDERVQIPYLLEHVEEIECTITRSEKEALILEQALIQRIKPRYNVLLKDDKSQLRIVITQHEYPKLELNRVKEIPHQPLFQSTAFASSPLARDMFDLVAHVYQLRQCSDAEFKRRKRPCILYHIKKCTAPCVGKISEAQYSENVQKAIRLLKGDVKPVSESIKELMLQKSSVQEFEQALTLRKRLELLDSFVERCKIEAVRGVMSCDVIGFWHEGRSHAFSTLRYRDGRLQESSVYISPETWSTAQEALLEFLFQFYRKNTSLDVPDEILLPMQLEDPVAFQEYLEIRSKIQVPLVGPKTHLIKIANENAKSRLGLSIHSDEMRAQVLYDIQEALRLRQAPLRIDCFDSSHLSGSDCVVCSVSFVNGRPHKAGYRTFMVKLAKAGDDYGMLREALVRRYQSIEEEHLPDLILIDGGKGQLSSAVTGIENTLARECELVAISKEEGRHDRGLRREVLLRPVTDALPHGYELKLEPTHPVLLFLQSVRDEAHRFVLEYQKKRRVKRVLLSQLDGISGIGPTRKKLLLKKFGSIEAIAKASVEEIVNQTNIPKRVVEGLLEVLKVS